MTVSYVSFRFQNGMENPRTISIRNHADTMVLQQKPMTDFGGEGLSDKSSARVLKVYVSNNLTWDEGSQGTVNYTTHIGR
uniref:Uncharacterized protein n=1 Tax=Timema monikensis TaxID=170555 RepID=A0A7R9EG78_9NEOP|nr:unnamed protein product [Timema monikensis]